MCDYDWAASDYLEGRCIGSDTEYEDFDEYENNIESDRLCEL